MHEKSASRIKSLPESIFTTMSKLAVEMNAVNLGQGFPDFDGPEWLMVEAFKAMKESKNQYAPSPGILSLRKAIAEIEERYYGLSWDPVRNITITAGATEALYSTINALIEQGDEVILFEPFYDAHQTDIILAGGIPRYATLHKPNFCIDFDELMSLINKKTKAIIINTPHNPTGKVFNKDELLQIAEIAIENDLLVISDEVYEFLTFDNAGHFPIVKIDGMAERTVTISSTGKTFGMTGWKIGYAKASEKLTSSIRQVHQWVTFAVNTPAQHAMAYGFGQLESYLPGFKKLYQGKRDLIINQLAKTKFRPHIPLGSYFIMVDIPDGFFKDDIDAAKRLVSEQKVATIPPSVFYGKSDDGKSMLRLCFAKNENTIREGIAKLGLI